MKTSTSADVGLIRFFREIDGHTYLQHWVRNTDSFPKYLNKMSNKTDYLDIAYRSTILVVRPEPNYGDAHFGAKM